MMVIDDLFTKSATYKADDKIRKKLQRSKSKEEVGPRERQWNIDSEKARIYLDVDKTGQAIEHMLTLLPTFFRVG